MTRKYIFTFLIMMMSLATLGFSSTCKNFDSHILTFNTQQQDYLFSTIFDFSSENGSLGSALKSSFRIRTNYDLYTPLGDYEGTGTCRLLTLGVVYSWGTEIDIYDQNHAYLGMIDGQVVTGAAAKFSIYDAEGMRVGIAYLDRNQSIFTIVDPENEQRYIASFRRNFIKDTVDNWNIQVYDQETIDRRIIKIFAAFAVDTQETFKEDL